MKSEDPSQLRAKTEESRRRPQVISEALIRYEGMGEVPEIKVSGPVHLTIEATDQHGEIAPWFDDFWWTQLLQHWTDRMVTVHIAPTPHACMHPVVLYHMDMLDRVVPRWRMIAFTFTNDMEDEKTVSDIAQAPYHEIRFIDDLRQEANNLDHRLTKHKPLEQIFGDIRREQQRIGASRPILTRLPASVKTLFHSDIPTSQADVTQSTSNITTQPTG